jgi:hypothetical protein|tara:strand:- start:420 stop:887 length:468 start_codon:yes stop_codon:yes gene_type:complete
MHRDRWIFFILSFILILMWSSNTNARNDYLNDRNCERGRVELYTELDRYDYDQRMNSDNDYFSDSGKIGLRFSWPLQSTCDNDTIDLIQENQRLMQELELLKTCGKYKDLELGDQFATVREMCKGVSKKSKVVKEDKELKKNKKDKENEWNEIKR